MENSIPTLNELFIRYRFLIEDAEFEQYAESFLTIMHGVASGSSSRFLTNESAQLAAQTVLVVYYHVKKEMESQ
jgi:hypothetical protein